MEYLKQSSADIAFIQELNQKQDKFKQTRSLLKKGFPSFDNNDYRGVEDALDHIDKWKCEGSPSIDGPNGGCSGGTAVVVKAHIW